MVNETNKSAVPSNAQLTEEPTCWKNISKKENVSESDASPMKILKIPKKTQWLKVW